MVLRGMPNKRIEQARRMVAVDWNRTTRSSCANRSVRSSVTAGLAVSVSAMYLMLYSKVY